MPNRDDLYWEDYSSQDPSEYQYLGYEDRSGNYVLVAIEDDIDAQLDEIYRSNGRNVNVRIYRQE